MGIEGDVDDTVRAPCMERRAQSMFEERIRT